MTTSGYVEIDSGKLYYETTGSGVPLVLIHGGLGLDRKMWEPQWQTLDSEYCLIRYDLRGCGKSSPPSNTPYFHDEDLKVLLDHLEVEKAHILGLSLGAHIAISFVMANPERTLSLIPVDGAIDGFEFRDTQFWPKVGQLIAHILDLGLTEHKHLILEHELFASAMQQPQNAELLRRIIADYSGWHWLNNAGMNTPHDPPAIDRLESIYTSTLVIVGERDINDMHRAADVMISRIPGAKKAVIANAGHMSNMEDVEEFNRTVKGFLRSL
jgi:pimeloyl-ACP methyl ester carboxylesterase